MTIAIGYELAAVSALPPWWRRRDPYILVPLVLIHAIISGPAFWGVAAAPSSALVSFEGLFFGVVLGQCLLLGIWAALGLLPLLVRWTLIAGAFLMGMA